VTTSRAAILLYHRVGSPETDVYGLSIPAPEFRAQMAHLRACYHPMSLEELVAAARADSIPDHAVAVTFDDGYLDNFVQASPVLTEFAVPATFFIATGGVDDDREFWWDALERVFFRSTALPTTLQIDLPEGVEAFATATPEERLNAHATIYRALVGKPAHVRDEAIGALLGWSGLPPGPDVPRQRMDRREIVALAGREGHDVGAHTVEHLLLPQQSREVQRQEIEQSKQALQLLLGRPVNAFAYPFGAFDDETVNIVRDVSFKLAVTCESQCVERGAKPLQLPRLEVTSGHSPNFDQWLRDRLRSETPTFVL
jgi:peptidoglycan/xylan/chitin deacetylase (PgdA/CDA1 family)